MSELPRLTDDDDNPDDEIVNGDFAPGPDPHGRQRYLDKCQELGISPVSQVLKYLDGKEMHVAHYGFSFKSVLALCEALKMSQSLSVLRLADNSISDLGVRVIANTIHTHRNITELDLSGNIMATDGCLAMSNMLMGRGSNLRMLGLARMKLGDKEATSLAMALENNTMLKCLDLSHNDFSERAICSVGAMLQVNIGLTDLQLNWNKARHRGAAAVAEGLKGNVNLQVLGMSCCGLKDGGAVAMGSMLKINQSLLDLDLSGNGISCVGGQALAEGVAANTSLAAITLDNNDLQEGGGQAVLAAVTKNQGLVVCRIDSTNVSDAIRSTVEGLLAPRVAYQQKQKASLATSASNLLLGAH